MRLPFRGRTHTRAVRLSDGRVAEIAPYNKAHVARVDALMAQAGFPRTGALALAAGLVHGQMLPLLAIETIDGQAMTWPAPTMHDVAGFMESFASCDIEAIKSAYVVTVPAGAPITLPHSAEV